MSDYIVQTMEHHCCMALEQNFKKKQRKDKSSDGTRRQSQKAWQNIEICVGVHLCLYNLSDLAMKQCFCSEK